MDVGHLRELVRRTGIPFGLKLTSYRHHAPVPLELPASYSQEPPVEGGPSMTVVTPSFRQARFLEGTLDSVLGQYERLEYVVIDGGSDDGTVEILRRYGARLTRWVSERDRGQSDAINKGFAGSHGEVMGWLNADDRLTPGALRYVARYFRDHPDVDAVYGHRIVIDPEGREIGRWILPRHRPAGLRWADYIPQETLFWRRALWDAAGGRVDPDYHFALDWELLLRFELAGARFARLPRFLGLFTHHPDQKSVAVKETTGRREFEALRARYLDGGPGALLRERAASYAFLARHMAYDVAHRAGLLRY